MVHSLNHVWTSVSKVLCFWEAARNPAPSWVLLRLLRDYRVQITCFGGWNTLFCELSFLFINTGLSLCKFPCLTDPSACDPFFRASHNHYSAAGAGDCCWKRGHCYRGRWEALPPWGVGQAVPGGVPVPMYHDSLSIADKAGSTHHLNSSCTKSHLLSFSESNFCVKKKMKQDQAMRLLTGPRITPIT